MKLPRNSKHYYSAARRLQRFVLMFSYNFDRDISKNEIVEPYSMQEGWQQVCFQLSQDVLNFHSSYKMITPIYMPPIMHEISFYSTSYLTLAVAAFGGSHFHGYIVVFYCGLNFHQLNKSIFQRSLSAICRYSFKSCLIQICHNAVKALIEQVVSLPYKCRTQVQCLAPHMVPPNTQGMILEHKALSSN